MIQAIIKTACTVLIAFGVYILSTNSLHNFDNVNVKRVIKDKRDNDSLHKIHRISDKLDNIRKAVITAGIKIPYLIILCTVSGIFGYITGLTIFDSLIMELAMCFGASFIPLVYIHIKNSKKRLDDLDKLCSSMMLISNSYMASDDLIACIRENIKNLEYPKPFEEFLTYVTLMDSSVVSGLIRMESMVGISYFTQWTDALILAQSDRRLKYVTLSIVDSFHDNLSAIRKSDARMHSVWQEYILTIALVVCVPAVFRVFMPDAYTVMVTSLAGKLLLCLLIASVVYSLTRALKINTPDIV